MVGRGSTGHRNQANTMKSLDNLNRPARGPDVFSRHRGAGRWYVIAETGANVFPECFSARSLRLRLAILVAGTSLPLIDFPEAPCCDLISNGLNCTPELLPR